MRRCVRWVLAVLGGLVLVLGALYFSLALPAPRSCPGSAPMLAGGRWSRGPEMPGGRSEIAAAALGDRIYVGGGLGLTGASRAFEAYDLASDSWQSLARLPKPMHHFALTALGERLYLSGGYEGNNLNRATDSLWIYDPATDDWSSGPAMPDARAAHAAVALDGKLYVVGGAGVGSTFVWVFDPGEQAWESLPAMLPTAREHLAAVALEGRIYVIGGRWSGAGNLGTLEVFDPATGRWSEGQPMPTPRGGLTAAALGGRIHVTGGEAFGSGPSCTFAQHEVYDPADGSWTSLEPLPTPRHGLASATAGGRWHVIGGGTKAAALTLVSASDRLEIFTPSE
jgi:N-acetylneuraminic acid mutarotase